MQQTPAVTGSQDVYSRTVLWVMLIAIVPALLLAVPARTVTSIYLNDLLIFLDGAHRILSGQIPSRDYHTPIGALADLIPAMGLLITGEMGSAMPVGFGVFIFAFTPVMAHVLASRLRTASAIPVAVYISLVLAAPMNLGDTPTHLSFGMFYNRIGWAALTLLLLMYLPPHGHARLLADSLSAGFLVCIMVYTKISYGLVAVAFLCFMLLDRQQRGWVLFSLSITVSVTLLTEIVWSLPPAYLSDVAVAAHASGAVQGGMMEIFYAILRNLTDYVVLFIAAGLVLFAKWSTRDCLFWGLCAASGLLILNQNFQQSGIVILAAGAAVAAELAIRRQTTSANLGFTVWPGTVYLLLLVLVAPQIIERGIGLGLHFAHASTSPEDAFRLQNLSRITLIDADTPAARHYRYSRSYVKTIEDGARLLQSQDPEPSHVVVLDYVNPFSTALGIQPSRGDSSWNFLGRNFSRSHSIPPESYLGDTRFVMIPKDSLNPPTTKALLALYGDYLQRNFRLVAETAFWELHERWSQPGPR